MYKYTINMCDHNQIDDEIQLGDVIFTPFFEEIAEPEELQPNSKNQLQLDLVTNKTLLDSIKQELQYLKYRIIDVESINREILEHVKCKKEKVKGARG